MIECVFGFRRDGAEASWGTEGDVFVGLGSFDLILKDVCVCVCVSMHKKEDSYPE